MTVKLNNIIATSTTKLETPSCSELGPAIRVVKVDSSKNIQGLKKTIGRWYTLAKARLEALCFIDWDNKDKLAIADTSLRVINEIRRRFKKGLDGSSIYVAYDEENKIQGIALAKIQPKEAELECLATHPQNIDLFGKENQRKGVGLSLLTQVVSEVYTTSKNPLGLYAEPTAVSFYTKHGFAIRKDVPQKMTMPFLTLEHINMKNLLSQIHS